MGQGIGMVYQPDPGKAETYEKKYEEYCRLGELAETMIFSSNKN